MLYFNVLRQFGPKETPDTKLYFVFQPDDNNAVYRCEAKNRMVAQPLTAEIVMSVQVIMIIMLLIMMIMIFC